MSFASNLFNLRKERQISQEKLAEMLAVTRQTISNWELGVASPNTEQLKTISQFFNVSIDILTDKACLVEKSFSTKAKELDHSDNERYKVAMILSAIAALCFFLSAILMLVTYIFANEPYRISLSACYFGLTILWIGIAMLQRKRLCSETILQPKKKMRKPGEKNATITSVSAK